VTRGGVLLDLALALAACALAAAAVAQAASLVRAASASVSLDAPVVEARESLSSLPLCGGGDPECASWVSRWQGQVHRRAVYRSLRGPRGGQLVRVEAVACRKVVNYRVHFVLVRPGAVPRQVPWMRIDRYVGGTLQSPAAYTVYWRGGASAAGMGSEQQQVPLSGVLDGSGLLQVDYATSLPTGRWYRFEVRWGADAPVAWVCEVPW